MRHLGGIMRSCAGSTIAIVACLSTPIRAQTSDQTAVAAPTPQATDDVVGDIVVTAQRREERLQDVPISVTAISGAKLGSAGIVTTESLPQLAPGLVVTRANETPQFYLRGIGTQSNGAGEEGTVGVYVDGVLIPALSAAAFGLANVERVEVLKGPQGTLFGRNSTGGTIQIVTRTPSFTPVARASLGYGNYDTLESQAYFSGPLGRTVAADLALSYRDQGDGFGTNIFNKQDVYKTREFAAAGKLLWKLGEATRITLAGDYDHIRSSFGNGRQTLPGVVGTAGTLYTGNFYNLNNNVQPLSIVKQGGGSLRVEQDVGFATLVSLTAYRRADLRSYFDVEGSPLPIFDYDRTDRTRQFTEEVQLQSSTTSPVQWIAGLYYLDAEARFDGVIRGGGAGATGYSRTLSRMKTRSIAPFAQVTVPLGNSTRITGGLRYTNDRRTFDGTVAVNPPPAAPVLTIPSAANPAVPGRKIYEKLTYRAALDHKFDTDILGYVSYSRGFKSGLYNLSNISNPPVGPETLDAVEIGLKSELLDRRLRLNLAGYRYWYDGVQLTQRVGATQFLLNAAKAKVLGIDGEIEARPTRHLTLDGSFSALIDAEYERFPGAPYSANNGVIRDANPATLPAGVTCFTPQPVVPVGGNRGGCNFDAAGKRLIRAPRFTFNLGGRYDIPTAAGKIGLGVNYTHTSRYFFEPDNRLFQPAYGLLNAEVSLATRDDRFTIAGWARNLLDRRYYAYQTSAAADNFAAGNPRTYGVTLRTKL